MMSMEEAVEEAVEEEAKEEEVRRVFLPLRPASALFHLLGPSAGCHSNGVGVREKELCWTNSSFTSSPATQAAPGMQWRALPGNYIHCIFNASQ